MANVRSSAFTELNGYTYLLVSLLDSSVRGARLYRIAPDSTRPEYVLKLEPGTAYQAVGYRNRIYLVQAYRDYPSNISGSRIYYYEPATGDATLVAEVATPDKRSSISSMTILDGKLYYYVNRRSSENTLESWEIWRSTGEPGDSVQIYSKTLERLEPDLGNVFSGTGSLTTSDSSIWFRGLDPI